MLTKEEIRPVRKGEEIDAKRLGAFLASELGVHSGEIDVAQFPAGSSNLTYLIRIGSDEYVLRRPPFGNTVATAHDMKREFSVLSKLSKVYPPAPLPLIYSADVSIIGSEFYLMERRHGLIVRGQFPSNVAPDAEAHASARANHPTSFQSPQPYSEIDTSQLVRQQVCDGFVSALAELHSIDLSEAGLNDLGKPDGYVRRQVEGWSKRYFAAKTGDVSDIEKAIVWLNDSIPAETGASLIHNDYKFDNVMLDPADLTRVSTVLDWEMVTVGDPLMDLGTTLGYWMGPDAGEEMLNMPFNPRVLMENISRAELVEMYAEKVRRNLPDILFYHVFGTFKIAVICQQIYARYVKGFTTDERFAGFDWIVSKLGKFAFAAIQTGRI